MNKMKKNETLEDQDLQMQLNSEYKKEYDKFNAENEGESPISRAYHMSGYVKGFKKGYESCAKYMMKPLNNKTISKQIKETAF